MEYVNGGFKGDSEMNGFHIGDAEGSSSETSRMDKYRISDSQWNEIQERLKQSQKPERSNSRLSQYQISEEQWNNVEKHLKSNGVDPGRPPTKSRAERPSSIKGPKDRAPLSRQTSEDSGYAKLSIMKDRWQSLDSREYEKLKKPPHSQNKDSSLQQKIQQRKELSQSTHSISSEAIQDLGPLTIPKDGNIQSFSIEDMATFFRYMRIDEYVVQRLIRKNLDGVKFSKLTDTDLENIGINTPIIVHFRDRSNVKKIPFIL